MLILFINLNCEFKYLFFNLKKTIPFFRRNLHFLKKSTQNHYCMLFIGSHDYVTGLIRYMALNSNQHSISKKWVGGTLTNWLKIRPYVRFLYSTTIAKIRKKFILRTEKKIEQKFDQYLKMKALLQGIEAMPALPNLVVILEKEEFSYPLKEAYKLMIPIITIVNTNQSGFFIAYPFFGNDFLMDTLYFYSNLILESLKEGLFLRRLFFIKTNLEFILELKENTKNMLYRLSRFDQYMSHHFNTFFRLFRDYKSYATRNLLKKYGFIFQLNQKTNKKQVKNAVNKPYTTRFKKVTHSHEKPLYVKKEEFVNNKLQPKIDLTPVFFSSTFNVRKKHKEKKNIYWKNKFQFQKKKLRPLLFAPIWTINGYVKNPIFNSKTKEYESKPHIPKKPQNNGFFLEKKRKKVLKKTLILIHGPKKTVKSNKYNLKKSSTKGFFPIFNLKNPISKYKSGQRQNEAYQKKGFVKRKPQSKNESKNFKK